MMVASTVALVMQIALATGMAPAEEASAFAGPVAAAKRAQKVCRDRVSLRHAPAGATIGYLHRGDRVIVTQYARRHRWAFGLSANGYGWLLTSALCRRSGSRAR